MPLCTSIDALEYCAPPKPQCLLREQTAVDVILNISIGGGTGYSARKFDERQTLKCLSIHRVKKFPGVCSPDCHSVVCTIMLG